MFHKTQGGAEHLSRATWNLGKTFLTHSCVVSVDQLNLQIDEHGYVEEQRADGDGGDVHGEVAPPRHGPQVDAVPATVNYSTSQMQGHSGCISDLAWSHLLVGAY